MRDRYLVAVDAEQFGLVVCLHVSLGCTDAACGGQFYGAHDRVDAMSARRYHAIGVLLLLIFVAELTLSVRRQ
jgi:hypothetical protein